MNEERLAIKIVVKECYGLRIVCGSATAPVTFISNVIL